MPGHATTNNQERDRQAQQEHDRDDLALLEETVRAAGDIARGYFGASYKRWNKEGGSPVTEADLAVDRHLHAVLTAARPGYGWLSEESADNPDRLEKDRTFVVDPIDGTVAFLKQRPHFTICAAVVAQGRPRCGAVYNPMTDELYSARLNGGAHRNGAPIRVGTREALADCAMLGDRTQLVKAPWPAMHVQNRNSVAYRVVLVADGSVDASVSLTPKRDWDLAAADIILTEAGGWLTTASGQPMIYNRAETLQPSLVAANPALHDRIAQLLRQ